ncbi:MAG: hypothetical protein HOV81_40060 [Kofleriaceae bacterium]|nr:hypothetical protein [Kofleriaceae bacterium]
MNIATDAERSLRAARIAGALGTIGLAVDSLVGSPNGPPVAQLVAIVICGVLWMATYVERRPDTVAYGSALFVLLNTTIIVGLWMKTQQLVDSGVNFVPFRAQRLGALAIALIAPPVAWVGVVAIVEVIGAAVVQYMLFTPDLRAHLPYGDPWSTLFYGGFALGLLFYRRRADRQEYETARALADADAYQRLARAMIAVRDLSNTPLQTLTNMIAVLRRQSPELGETADRLERAVSRLTELEQATRPFERELVWKPGDESWDPKAILRIESLRQ